MVNRSGEALTAELQLGVESYDDVRTGNSRVGLTFIDDSVVRLTEHSKLILDEVIFDPDPSKSKIGLTFELVMAFEEEFGIEIPDDAAETIQSFGDAVKFITEAS